MQIKVPEQKILIPGPAGNIEIRTTLDLALTQHCQSVKDDGPIPEGFHAVARRRCGENERVYSSSMIEGESTTQHCQSVKATGYIGIICHPHPLHRGTMHNKVVTTIARAFETMQIATVRFNFRGVGESDGCYGNAVGEMDDLAAVIDWVHASYPNHFICLAGFSFGSYISSAYLGRTQSPRVRGLISVAPPVQNFPFADIPPVACPWLVIQGEEDEIVASHMVTHWVEQRNEPIHYVSLDKTTHFFHGRLLDVRQIIVDWLTGVSS